MSMAQKGKKLTEEHKRKLSEAQKGDRNSAKRLEVREKISKTLTGRKLSKETRRRMSIAQRNMSEETKRRRGDAIRGDKNPMKKMEVRRKISEARSGSKSNFWKGGITPENERVRRGMEFRSWREAVFARDDWTCQKYGIRGCRLHAHHIENFADHLEMRFEVDNGITLSKEAHDEFHKMYGYQDNTKNQVEEFLAYPS